MVKVTKLDVQCSSCNSIVSPDGPANKRLFGVGLAVLVGGFGFFTGSAIGIATAGLGVAATIPLTLFGIAIGWSIGSYLAQLRDGVTCPECGRRFGSRIPGR